MWSVADPPQHSGALREGENERLQRLEIVALHQQPVLAAGPVRAVGQRGLLGQQPERHLRGRPRIRVRVSQCNIGIPSPRSF